jgi:hypothetical protein
MTIPDTEWQQEHKIKYEQCDTQMIAGMLQAKRQTKKTKLVAWSPMFAKAVSNKAFWKIAVSLKMTHKYPSDKFLRWAEDLGVPNIRSLDIQMLKKELRLAQKQLKDIKNQAENLRTEHLRTLLTQTELEENEKQQERRLKILIRAHEQKKHFKRLKQIFKPNESGGLSYILVPEKFSIEEFPYDPNNIQTWERIHDHKKLQSYLQHRNLVHFGQAQGTPFTVPPLDRLTWQANSLEANEILQGAIPTEFLTDNPYVNKVLQYMAD